MAGPNPETAFDVLASAGVVSVLSRLADWWHGERGFVVLNYHRVGGRDDPFFPSLSTRSFATQMLHLAEHWNVLPVDELVQRAGRRELPPRAVGITFDDNYAGFHEIAWPLLRGLGLPVTLFVPTGPLVHRLPLWFDRCAHALKTTGDTRLPALGIRGFDGVELGGPEERADLARSLVYRLKELDEDRRRDAVRRLEEELEPAPYESEPALEHGAVEDLRRVAAEGVGIGSHSVSHPIFSRLSRKRARVELRDSRATLESWLGEPVELFAYPNGQPGDYTEETLQELEAAGYRAAFTTSCGLNGVGQSPYTIRRGNGWQSNGGRFGLYLARLFMGDQDDRPLGVRPLSRSA